MWSVLGPGVFVTLWAAQGENHCPVHCPSFQMGPGCGLTVRADEGQVNLAEDLGVQALTQGSFWSLLNRSMPRS